jgi:prepilin signal peptidase PulO-like enzyme (type II secretory pathway)
MVPWGGLFRVAVLAVVASLICLPILPLGLPVVWELLIGFALFTTVYAVAALKADLITGDDILTVRRWLMLGTGLPLRKAL